jgi:hypothetical protein
MTEAPGGVLCDSCGVDADFVGGDAAPCLVCRICRAEPVLLAAAVAGCARRNAAGREREVHSHEERMKHRPRPRGVVVDMKAELVFLELEEPWVRVALFPETAREIAAQFVVGANAIDGARTPKSGGAS